MDKKTKQCIKMLRDLVSDVQGAPFPSGDLKNELKNLNNNVFYYMGCLNIAIIF